MHSIQQQNPQGYSNEPSIASKEEAVILQIRTTTAWGDEKNIDTKMKGDKLIFTQSNSVNRNKIGSRPTAEEIITTDVVKAAVHSGKSIEDNGNRFIGHSVPA